MIVLPTTTLQAGTREIGPANVPNGVTRFELSFDCSTWTNPARSLSCQIEISLDGGTNWRPFVAFGLRGTDAPRDKQGVARVFISSSIPEPANPNRRFRATLTFSGPDWTTTGELTLT